MPQESADPAVVAEPAMEQPEAPAMEQPAAADAQEVLGSLREEAEVAGEKASGLFTQAMQMANDVIQSNEDGEEAAPEQQRPESPEQQGFMNYFTAPRAASPDLNATASHLGDVSNGHHPHRAQKSLSERHHTDHVLALLAAAEDSSPPRFAKVIHALRPVVAKLLVFIDKVGPPALFYWGKFMVVYNKLPHSVRPRVFRRRTRPADVRALSPVAFICRRFEHCTASRSVSLAACSQTP